jgi:tetrahydromethanopterin S-methyltransferase subunit G
MPEPHTDPDEIQKLNQRLASFWDIISERLEAVEKRLDAIEKNAT